MRLESRLPVIDGRNLGANCDECPLNGRRVVPPQKNNNATLIVLGESPGKNEEIKQQPFVGESGKLLDRILQRFAISRSRLHITNAVLCRPDASLSPKDWKRAIAACRPR